MKIRYECAREQAKKRDHLSKVAEHWDGIKDYIDGVDDDY